MHIQEGTPRLTQGPCTVRVKPAECDVLSCHNDILTFTTHVNGGDYDDSLRHVLHHHILCTHYSRPNVIYDGSLSQGRTFQTITLTGHNIVLSCSGCMGTITESPTI